MPHRQEGQEFLLLQGGKDGWKNSSTSQPTIHQHHFPWIVEKGMETSTAPAYVSASVSAYRPLPFGLHSLIPFRFVNYARALPEAEKVGTLLGAMIGALIGQETEWICSRGCSWSHFWSCFLH
ncbi:hypothetical protein Pint_18272 [Pistacia integerrima]|uniref:Uncharacterized protein n=1 Tax=Pistacia integerrima TaxID=434235 RepID=A0ACC0YYD3_9ROSI|nr:hypothetical protein Pint_18272 [Pistacia integerrima]